MVALRSQAGASTGFEFGQRKGSDQVQRYKDYLNGLISARTVVGGNSDQVQRYKDYLNGLISARTMVGGENALKHSKLILPEKTWKGTKTVFFKI